MDKELALKWAEALESGRYKQTFVGVLKEEVSTGLRYCCLGVLCRVAIKLPAYKKHRKQIIEDLEDGGTLSDVSLDKKRSLRTAVGMSSAAESCFMSLNDDVEEDFKAIAKEVRKRYKV